MTKVFGYKRFESAKDILQGFCKLLLVMYIDYMHLLWLYDCLKRERSVVRMYAEVSADDNVVKLCNLKCLILF